MLRQVVRKTFGLAVSGPMAAAVWAATPVMGREKAVEKVGPVATRMAEFSLRWWVPEIRDAGDFDTLRKGMAANVSRWSALFDLAIVEDGPDKLKLRVGNCPFCESLISLGLSDLAPYVCQGDWEKARKNAHKWGFERTCQIGTGEEYCDHTYLKKTGQGA